MPKLALYVPLKAKPGKETELKEFLKQGAQMAAQEPGTVTWYALDEGEGALRDLRYVRGRGRSRCSSEWADREGTDGEGRRAAGRAGPDP